LPPNTLLDGEIVALDESGRISFNLLQHHRSQAQALVFYAFDVLIYRGRSVLNVPLYFRRGNCFIKSLRRLSLLQWVCRKI
jgi:bifunctional non-homologous end joining protein LigD